MTEPKVAIIIPTLNRADFVIRQLSYYVSVNCPHPIYIGDSSTEEHAQKIREAVKNLRNKIQVKYKSCPELNERQAVRHLLEQGGEDYACFIGDDDYQIPISLSLCAEFLETHPDYTSVHGRAVTFRLTGSGAYGTIKKIGTYRQDEIEFRTGAERLLFFLENYYVTVFSVHRREQILKYFQDIDEIPDKSFSAEILPCALSMIDGKSKLLDCLSFVRQVHDVRYELPNPFDWITSDIWARSYQIFENLLTKALALRDNISLDQARLTVRQAFWHYLHKYLTADYFRKFPEQKPMLKNFKQNCSTAFPFLKIIYQRFFKCSSKNLIHNQILNPSSPYYSDFQPVMESFLHPPS